MILDDILIKKKEYLERQKSKTTLQRMKELVSKNGRRGGRDFFSTIKEKKGLSVIAEIKKASPSKGVIREDFEPLDIAREYYAKGVDAISVLTETDFFMGRDEYLVKIRQALPVPLLRKDFIIDIWQVYQSAYLGADAILLIVSILNDMQLKKFQAVARILGMQCLVEVHSEGEVERALETGAKIIGINNRDLGTFDTDIEVTGRLLGMIPNDRAVVSESGIRTAEDMKYLEEAGADAVLIGETFMSAERIAAKVRELMNYREVEPVEG